MKKTILNFMTTMIVAMIVSTCSKGKEQGGELRNALVVLQDESSSVQKNDDTQISTQKLFLKKYLNQHFKAQTDILILKVNSFSGASTNHEVIPYNLPITDSETYSESEELLQESAQQQEEFQQKIKMEKKLFKILFSDKVQPSSQTAILEVLTQFERLTKPYNSVEIIFLSDMMQESSMRNFSKNLPEGKQQAENFANEDSKKLQIHFSLPDKTFQKVQRITVLVPSGNDSKMVNLPHYWEKLFQNFGFRDTVEWNNK
ncbi:hypothetical protein [Chryseobacterium oryctis]|uniref:Lipoprotein n=1 Tax=Chryseobacterium oryctis TaxID=2952618 RepID=A0ABT3HIT8_9FLAO|nr:hypothetical protein [Chryseobacterium oryctis]MCW3159690.1 hypothetical protein [Chryseobacterium oryctis]